MRFSGLWSKCERPLQQLSSTKLFATRPKRLLSSDGTSGSSSSESCFARERSTCRIASESSWGLVRLFTKEEAVISLLLKFSSTPCSSSPRSEPELPSSSAGFRTCSWTTSSLFDRLCYGSDSWSTSAFVALLACSSLSSSEGTSMSPVVSERQSFSFKTYYSPSSSSSSSSSSGSVSSFLSRSYSWISFFTAAESCETVTFDLFSDDHSVCLN